MHTKALPIMAAHTEPASTAILPVARRLSISAGAWSLNDRVSTKMLIVNPIPPRQATAKNIGQVVPCGFSPILSFTQIRLKRVIPRGLPSMSPSMMPSPTPPAVSALGFNSTPALARAKRGMIRKLTQGERALSRV